MKRLAFFTGLCLLTFRSIAQQGDYNVSLIPKPLLSYAGAVIRTSEQTLQADDQYSYNYHCKKAITVLNKSGLDEASLYLYYDKMTSIKNVKGTIYDADGKLVGKFSDRDMKDYSAADGFSLFLDTRFKYFAPPVATYPFTVEYDYETRNRQTMYFHEWSPCDFGVSVQNSTYTFIAKPSLKINIKESNIPEKMTTSTTKNGMTVYTWSAANIKAYRKEPMSPSADKFMPYVRITSGSFFYDGYEGAFTDWNSLGKWIYDKLLVGRDVVPQETVDHIKDITANITDPKEKARKIYEFVQQKTRYVSIQVGIGGYQPFTAANVDQNSYGDCKALVNYTKALLKTVGIDAWYCVVYGERAVKRSMTTDFASMEGNHIILCVPFKNDTTWAECTSRTNPFGFIGDFTDDRVVLACTPDGGKLMHTRRYPPQENLTHRTGQFTISNTGMLAGDMKTTFGGTEFDDRDRLIDEAYQEQVKDIHNEYNINNLDVQQLKFVKHKSETPVTTETMSLKAVDFATDNNGRVYFLPNLADRHNYVPDDVRNRSTDVYINRGYVDEDEFTYTLPDGYKLDKELISRDIEKPFGAYKLSMNLTGNKLTLKRRLQINDGTFNKDEYENLIDFYEAVAHADNYQVVLTKLN